MKPFYYYTAVSITETNMKSVGEWMVNLSIKGIECNNKEMEYAIWRTVHDEINDKMVMAEIKGLIYHKKNRWHNQ